jgi:hypothetical protein
MSEAAFGPDPLGLSPRSANEMPADMRTNQAPAAPGPMATVIEPDPSTPLKVDVGRVHSMLAERQPETVRELGIDGVAAASSTLAELPGDLVRVLDDAGALGSTLSWHLLAQLRRNGDAAQTQDGSAIELEPAGLAAWAREQGLDDSPEVISNVDSFLCRHSR